LNLHPAAAGKKSAFAFSAGLLTPPGAGGNARAVFLFGGWSDLH